MLTSLPQKFNAMLYQLYLFIMSFCLSQIYLKNIFQKQKKFKSSKKREQNLFKNYAVLLYFLIEDYTESFFNFKEEMQLAFELHLINVAKAPTEFQIELIEWGEDNIINFFFLDTRKDTMKYGKMQWYAIIFQ